MTNKHTLESITIGNSWACKFQVHTFVNSKGEPVDTRNLAVGDPVPDATPGYYKGIGIIKTRDTNNRLVELHDTVLERDWIVGWNDCWDIDHIEWRE